MNFIKSLKVCSSQNRSSQTGSYTYDNSWKLTSHKTSNGILLEKETYRIWFNVWKHLWPATNNIVSCFLPCFPCTEIVELDVDNSYELLRDTKMVSNRTIFSRAGFSSLVPVGRPGPAHPSGLDVAATLETYNHAALVFLSWCI